MAGKDEPTSREKAAIGKRLAAARTAVGLNQDHVAEALEVKKGTVSAWEKGRNNLDAVKLRQLVMLYGTPADALLDTIEFSEPALRLAALFDRLPEDRQEEAYTAVAWTLRQIQRESETQQPGRPNGKPRLNR